MRLRTVRAAGLLLLLLLALPAAAQAQYIYTTNNGTITLRGYIGPGGVVNIPSTIDGLPDTSIGEDAFFGQSRLTSVTIPNGVTSIGFSAFASCDGLTNVTIPDSVTDIYFEAFSGCASLTSVTIPKSVRHIGFAPFSACSNLTAITVEPLNDSFSSVDGVLFDKSQTTLFRYPGGRTGSYAIPNGVTGIEYKAFTDCNNLSSVSISKSFTNLGYGAFASCTSLTAITVDALNPAYSSVDGVLFDKSQATLIRYSAGRAGSYTIPNSVIDIADSAFYHGSGLTGVTIPKSVRSIGYLGFSECPSLSAITVDAFNSTFSSVDGVLFDKSQATLIQYPRGKAGSYTIPNSVTDIADFAFFGCISLTSVTIPNAVAYFGYDAFRSCTTLTNVTIPNSVTRMEDAFSGCSSLTAITVQPLNSAYSSVDGVLFNKRQTWLFQYPGGKTGSYTIPDSITSIELSFAGCINLTSVTIPNSVTNIGNSSFFGCINLTSVTIPNSVTTIGTSSFYSCTNLTNVTMGNGVTSIEELAFSQCASLTNVTIPNSVTNMERSAFYDCTNLTGVYFKGNAPSADFSVFPNDNNAIVYYLPGTTGWGPTFGGRPAVLWNPQVQTGSFGVQANQFGFTITGTSGLVVVVEACTNLVNPVWSALGTTTLIGGASYFGDPQWTNYPTRLYRLRSP